MAVSDIKVAGRATQGVRLINIREGDSIAAISAVNKSEDATADQQVSPEAQTPESPEQTNE